MDDEGGGDASRARGGLRAHERGYLVVSEVEPAGGREPPSCSRARAQVSGRARALAQTCLRSPAQPLSRASGRAGPKEVPDGEGLHGGCRHLPRA